MVIEMSKKPRKVVKKKPTPEVTETICTVDSGMSTVEAIETITSPEPVAEVETKEMCLDDRLLFYFKELKGNFNIHKACVALEVENADLIYQAYDRLYDKHLVPYMNIR